MALPRRRLFALTAAAALGLSGCGSAGSDQPGSDGGSDHDGVGDRGTRYPDRCIDRSALPTHAQIGSSSLVYDISTGRSRFAFDPGFHAQLETWLADWVALSGQPTPTSVWTYGTWTDGERSGCRSWHHQGRAIDISRLLAGSTAIASARYDLWNRYTGAQRQFHEQRYWALAASLHDHFAYVLTYLYDDLHHNHLHVDNGRSGAERSVFDRGSSTQVQAVQAICGTVWGVPCEITGDWDFSTRRVSRAVLEQIGATGSLTDDDNWRQLLRATVPRAVQAAQA